MEEEEGKREGEKEGEWQEQKERFVERIRGLEGENNELKARVQELERLLQR